MSRCTSRASIPRPGLATAWCPSSSACSCCPTPSGAAPVYASSGIWQHGVQALAGLFPRCLVRIQDFCRHSIVESLQGKGGFENHTALSMHSPRIVSCCHQAMLCCNAGRQACNAVAAARRVHWTQGYPRPSSWARPQVSRCSSKLLCGDAVTHSRQRLNACPHGRHFCKKVSKLHWRPILAL